MSGGEELAVCRCGHHVLDHAGDGPCENGDGCGRGCRCRAYVEADRPWRCVSGHDLLGPDDGGLAVRCPTCRAMAFAQPRAGR